MVEKSVDDAPYVSFLKKKIKGHPTLDKKMKKAKCTDLAFQAHTRQLLFLLG
jgi:hypothetical protein